MKTTTLNDCKYTFKIGGKAYAPSDLARFFTDEHRAAMAGLKPGQSVTITIRLGVLTTQWDKKVVVTLPA